MGKNDRLALRIGSDAKQEIEKRAQNQGVSVAKFIRMSCIQDKPILW